MHWDTAAENWRMMRFRDDKPHGNHRDVVENIIQSIADGVERDVVRAPLYPSPSFLSVYAPSPLSVP